MSTLIIKIPYLLGWHAQRLLKGNPEIAFYLDSEHDYAVIEHILPHVHFPFILLARNRKLASRLGYRGIKAKTWPAFPALVIMARHSFHRFPIKAVRKIGLKHGPHFFKEMIHRDRFNAFDLFVFTSENEVRMAFEQGITNGVAGGYPRLDAFSHPATLKLKEKILDQIDFGSGHPNLLFTATWDRSGMSAASLWIDALPRLQKRYNIMVSLHPMMSKKFVSQISRNPGIFMAGPRELPAAMLAADVLIGDTSSALAEFCVLNKPIITFKINSGRRLTPEITRMISEISVQIENIDELDEAFELYFNNPHLKLAEREYWNSVFFDKLNFSHGEKTAEILNKFVREQFLLSSP